MKNKVGIAKMTVINITKPRISGTANNLLSKIAPVKNARATVLIITKLLSGKLCIISSSLPSLFIKIVSLIKVVLLKCLISSGMPRIVNQAVKKLKVLSFKNAVNCQPPTLRIQNTKFHIRSLLSHFSCALSELTWIKGLISLVVTILVKSCIIPFTHYSSTHHYIIPNISLLSKQILLALSTIILANLPNAAYSATKDEILELISKAEQESNIPRGLLLAISKIESNLQPLALNIKGQTMLAKDENYALQNIRQALNAGITNIDIGIMQLNYKWHQHNFTNLADMLKLETNIKYAAKLLVQLKQTYGNWHTAIRHYHSAEPKYHKKYSRKIVLCWLASN